jgi:hypothetical protein
LVTLSNPTNINYSTRKKDPDTAVSLFDYNNRQWGLKIIPFRDPAYGRAIVFLVGGFISYDISQKLIHDAVTSRLDVMDRITYYQSQAEGIDSRLAADGLKEDDRAGLIKGRRALTQKIAALKVALAAVEAGVITKQTYKIVVGLS